MASIDITQTKEYKRALKHHLKTRQNPPPDGGDISAFRLQEKKFKSKFPPPNLDEVLDVWALDEELAGDAIIGGAWSRGDNALGEGVHVRPFDLHPPADATARRMRGYTLSSHPGEHWTLSRRTQTYCSLRQV